MTRVLLAVGLAFVLGACSSGNGGNGDAMPSPTEDVQSELDKVKKQLADLMAMGRPEDQAEIMRLQGVLDMAEQQKQAEMEAGNAKMAVALLAGLQGDALATGTPTLALGKTLRGSGNDVSDVILKATNNVIGSQGNWQGQQYMHKMKNGPTNTAVLYTNKGPGSSKPWLDVYDVSNSGYDKGSNTLTFAEITDYAANVDSSNFDVASGDKTFKIPESGVVSIRGTYDGAMGTYRCTGTAGTACTATVAIKGFTLVGAGAWTFSPDAGAMVHQADKKYLVFGWWLQESDTGPMVGPITHNMGEFMAVGLEALKGSATYVGAAAGKYAIRSFRGGVADPGHFTASAILEADFSDNMITGTLDNFMGGDGEGRPWSVDFMEAMIGDGGTFGHTTAAACDMCMTQWSVDGVSEEKAGAWGGVFYDAIAAGKDSAGTPMSANGTFSAQYGAIGHMIGAFGAEKQ